MTNIKYQISTIQSQLEAVYPEDEACALAWWMMEEMTGLSRTQLQFGCKDTTFSSNMQEKLRENISRLLRFEPFSIFSDILYGTDWISKSLLQPSFRDRKPPI